MIRNRNPVKRKMTTGGNDMETYEEVELDAITLTDENGEDHDYAIVLVFPVNDISYAALCPILDGDIVDMDDVTFYRFEEDDEEVSLDDIESEEEAETVAREYELLCSEEDE